MAEQIMTQAPGNVWKVLVKVGDSVKAGETLFILEVMKTEVPHEAESGGVVSKLHIAEEDAVDVGQLAVEIE
ncbi:MAG: acetyl-CoA carboxylase biotin carboxyl carrier protein subunit [Rhodospirillaceae bacterium]|nr:acetyl-CoA carboxylase biotin carboxyl carrier protein subunit [Rhodospirillaceae bacterium]|tara:strand:+ start:3459 stop:3674 length:216 start_codon:yes stop_codon:yes gene_type:complete